jgi:hypothetical protein
VPKPFTWIVHDPSGMSEFKPMEGVEVEWDAAPEADGEEQPAVAVGAAAPGQQQQQQQGEEQQQQGEQQQQQQSAAATAAAAASEGEPRS